MSKMSCGLLCNVGIAIIAVALIVITPCAAQQLTNDKLSLTVNATDGAYQLAVRGGQLIFTSGVAAQVNHQWLRSTEYPRHQVSESTFSDELGSGRAITVTNSGLEGKADLIYVAPALRPKSLRDSPGDSAEQYWKGSDGAGHPRPGGTWGAIT